MNSTFKVALLWVIIIVLIFLLWNLFITTKGTWEEISYTTFLDRVDANAVRHVVIRGCVLRGETKPDAPGGVHDFQVTIPANYPYTYDALRAHNVEIDIETSNDSPVVSAIISWAPILFLIGLWMFFMRTIRRGVKVEAGPVDTKQ